MSYSNYWPPACASLDTEIFSSEGLQTWNHRRSSTPITKTRSTTPLSLYSGCREAAVMAMRFAGPPPSIACWRTGLGGCFWDSGHSNSQSWL